MRIFVVATILSLSILGLDAVSQQGALEQVIADLNAEFPELDLESNQEMQEEIDSFLQDYLLEDNHVVWSPAALAALEEACQNFTTDNRKKRSPFQSSAVVALQEASEAYLVGL